MQLSTIVARIWSGILWLYRRFWREPDFVIGPPETPYMRRWWVIPRNRWFNIYLHQILRNDDDQALHDHPWYNCSLLVSGEYIEQTQKARRHYHVGSILLRWAEYAHRLELIRGKPCWTLFITGPKIRSWGFLCPQGWVHYKDFVARDNEGLVGKGCNT